MQRVVFSMSFAGFLSLLFAALIFSPGPCAAQRSPSDFNLDSYSDLVTVTVEKNSEKSFSWSSYSFQGPASAHLGGLGKSGELPVLADWIGAGVPQIGSVRPDPKSETKALVWTIRTPSGIAMDRAMGQVGDLVLAGADFNNNGIADGAVARFEGQKVSWWIWTDPFINDDNPRPLSVPFGTMGDRAFYVNPDGAGDWLAVVRKGRRGTSTIILKNPFTGEERTIANLGRFLSADPRPRPFPIRQDDGRDLLGAAVPGRERTRFYLQALSPSEPLLYPLPGKGSLKIGNFNALPGEELALQAENGVWIFNPIANHMAFLDAPAGTIVDEVNVGQVGGTGAGNALGGNCSPTVSIRSLQGVLYKAVNVHGGRGPSFIVQNSGERPGHRALELRDMQCNLIGKLGFYQEGPPYGARYYSGVPGGTYADGGQLRQLAMKAGSPNFLIQGKGKWIQVSDPTIEREGNCCRVP